MINFIKPLDLDRSIADILSPDSFISDMVKLHVINKPTGSYGKDVKGLYGLATTWMLEKLKAWGLYNYAYVAEGYYRGKSTCWMVLEGYFYDLTLAQFVEGVPQLCIMRKQDAEKPHLYSIGRLTTAREWVAEIDENTTPFLNFVQQVKSCELAQV